MKRISWVGGKGKKVIEKKGGKEKENRNRRKDKKKVR